MEGSMAEASVSSIRNPSPVGTPQAREEYRKSLYKASPTSWRASYTERCKERMKQSREKFLDRYRAISSASTEVSNFSSPTTGNQIDLTVSNEDIRHSVREVMKREWESMRQEESSLTKLPVFRASAVEYMEQEFDEESDEVEYVLSIMDQLTQELIEEGYNHILVFSPSSKEKAILSQYNQQLYDENMRFSESMLCAAADSMTTQTAEVICPICQKYFLQQNLHIIFCACGLRLDTAQDCVSLEFVCQQLEDCTTLHSAACAGKPVFSFETTLGAQNIIMNCTQCDFMYIIV